ncbi:hypothetical protein D3C71_1978720 [compost metagenome]
MARITDQSIRLRKGLKISKQKMTSTAISPARIRTSSRPRDNIRSVSGLGDIWLLLVMRPGRRMERDSCVAGLEAPWEPRRCPPVFDCDTQWNGKM